MTWWRIRAVIAKEFTDFRRNRYVLYSMVALPLISLVAPVLSLTSLPGGAPMSLLDKVTTASSIEFLLPPLVLPGVLAGFAIVGERDQGTLEPLLSSPLSATELYVAKLLAVLAPTFVGSWGLYALTLVIVHFAAAASVSAHLITAPLVVRQLGLDVLLSGWAVLVGLFASSRASDVRVAQQLSALASVPVLLVIVLVVQGVISLSVADGVAFAGALLLVEIVGLAVLARTFDPERLLAPRSPRRTRSRGRALPT